MTHPPRYLSTTDKERLVEDLVAAVRDGRDTATEELSAEILRRLGNLEHIERYGNLPEGVPRIR